MNDIEPEPTVKIVWPDEEPVKLCMSLKLSLTVPVALPVPLETVTLAAAGAALRSSVFPCPFPVNWKLAEARVVSNIVFPIPPPSTC